MVLTTMVISSLVQPMAAWRLSRVSLLMAGCSVRRLAISSRRTRLRWAHSRYGLRVDSILRISSFCHSLRLARSAQIIRPGRSLRVTTIFSGSTSYAPISLPA